MILWRNLKKKSYLNNPQITVGPNKEIPVLRVTQPKLNLLVKPRFFFSITGKNIIERQKKKLKKKCVPTLPKISSPYPKHTYFFFIWPFEISEKNQKTVSLNLC